jgi:hypothetical protein
LKATVDELLAKHPKAVEKFPDGFANIYITLTKEELDRLLEEAVDAKQLDITYTSFYDDNSSFASNAYLNSRFVHIHGGYWDEPDETGYSIGIVFEYEDENKKFNMVFNTNAPRSEYDGLLDKFTRHD